MKKSMIISTIAMIVVVVVALSTATYAWFASSDTVKATTTLTATAGSGYQIRLLKHTAVNANTYNFDPYTDSVEMRAATAKEGIYAPTEVLTAKYTGTTTGTVTKNATDNKYFGAIGTSSYTIDTEATAFTPEVLQVLNVNKQAANMVITIQATTQSQDIVNALALNSFRFALFVTIYDTESKANVNYTITNAYNYGAKQNASTDSTYVKDQAITGKKDQVPATVEGPIYTGVSEGKYTAVLTSSNNSVVFPVLTYNEVSPATGLAVNSTTNYGLQYAITMPQIPGSSAMGLEVYTWIDGWSANPAASNGTYDVALKFGKEAATLFAQTA